MCAHDREDGLGGSVHRHRRHQLEVPFSHAERASYPLPALALGASQFELAVPGGRCGPKAITGHDGSEF
jgi:hypothetical protein